MKKIWVCFILVFVVIFVFVAGKTYSYYVEKYDNDVNYKVASWVVVVNDKDITLEENKNFVITEYNYTQMDDSELSEANNKFAPGMNAEFSILVDSSKVDVAFDYVLDIDMSGIDNENIRIAYVENSLNNIKLKDGKYVGYFDMDSVKQNKKDLIKVGIEWLDSKSTEDYEFVKNYDGTLSIPVSIDLKQKTE